MNLKNKLLELCRTLNTSQLFPLTSLPVFTLLSLYRDIFFVITNDYVFAWII